MKIAIYGQFYQTHSETPIKTLFRVLNGKEATVNIEAQFYNTLVEEHEIEVDGTYGTFDYLDDSYDILISIGGDGTFIRLSRMVAPFGVPILERQLHRKN